jgi:hypothetical protein
MFFLQPNDFAPNPPPSLPDAAFMRRREQQRQLTATTFINKNVV